MDHRKYRRAASGVSINFQLDRPDAASRDYYSGLVENYSYGGLFVATDAQLSVGDLLHLAIDVDGEPPFEARALVRWTRRWRRPRGAGVEFIDFDHLGEREIGDVLTRLFESVDDA